MLAWVLPSIPTIATRLGGQTVGACLWTFDYAEKGYYSFERIPWRWVRSEKTVIRRSVHISQLQSFGVPM